jgi:ATP-dependent Clp protease ATP-binding subunit ClpB
MLEGERERLLHLEDELGQRVIGQQEAVKAVSNAIRRSRAGLSDPNRPNGSFLFLGPTGVGKTELCKALAVSLFDTEDALIRIDMSEFMEKHSVARLIGAPPGYVGYEEGGYLTEAVRRRPYSVILLDEIEKAHPEVFNVLLQVLDDGRLTDGHGRTVDFRNTVLVMTSNVGSQHIVGLSESQRDEIEQRVAEALRAQFKPEFLNRVDDTIVFHQLGRDECERIVDIQLTRVSKLLAERRLTLAVSEAAKKLLADKGYDPHYGARPLKRVIQRMVLDPLSLKILEGDFPDGSKIAADAAADGQALEFETA